MVGFLMAERQSTRSTAGQQSGLATRAGLSSGWSINRSTTSRRIRRRPRRLWYKREPVCSAERPVTVRTSASNVLNAFRFKDTKGLQAERIWLRTTPAAGVPQLEYHIVRRIGCQLREKGCCAVRRRERASSMATRRARSSLMLLLVKPSAGLAT